MVIKKMLIAGAVLASLGTGTGVYAASSHSQSAHKASHTQFHEGTFHKGPSHHRPGMAEMKGNFLKEAATTLKWIRKPC